MTLSTPREQIIAELRQQLAAALQEAHWHHDRERDSCNYGNVAPLMDVLFGTHHDPGREPVTLGLREPAAKGYIGLLLNPLLPRRFHLQSTGPS